MNFTRLVELADKKIREELGDYYIIPKMRMENLQYVMDQSKSEREHLQERLRNTEEKILELRKYNKELETEIIKIANQTETLETKNIELENDKKELIEANTTLLNENEKYKNLNESLFQLSIEVFDEVATHTKTIKILKELIKGYAEWLELMLAPGLRDIVSLEKYLNKKEEQNNED